MKKKIVSTALAASLVFGTVAFASDADNSKNVKVTFDETDFSVTVDATNLGAINTVTTISLSDNGEEISPDNLPAFSYVYKTDSEGGLNEKILIPYSLGSGRCYVWLDSSEFSEKTSCVVVWEEDSETVSLLSEIANCTNGDEIYEIISLKENYENLGLDLDGVSDETLFEASKVCVGEIGDADSLSAKDFKNAFGKCLVYADIKNGGNIDKAMESYASVFGTTYEEYMSYSEDVRKTFGEIFKSASAEDKKLSQIYTDSILLACLKCCESRGECKELLLENADYIGIDVGSSSDYADIKKDNQYKVFLEVYSKKDETESVAQIAEAFDEAVEEVLESQENKKQSSSGSSSGGSKSSGSKVSVPQSFEQNIPASPVVIPTDAFSDISSHYSKIYVEQMAKKGIINGYEDKTFRPDNLVTRAEISKIIATALGLKPLSDASHFDDVSMESWYAPYVTSMWEKGYIKGFDGRFNPGDILKRQDIAVIMTNILSPYTQSLPDTQVSYTDAEEISDYARGSVATMHALGIMQGSDNTFRPNEGITRGDTAIVISRLLDYIGSVTQEG